MDENRLIKIEELEVGDEFLISANSGFRYYRVLRKPTINPKTGRYKAVRCSTNMNTVTRSYTDYQKQVVNYDVFTYICTSEGHNTEKSLDLRWKTLWLVRRGM